MEKGDRSTIITIIIVLVATVGTLIVVASIAWNVLSSTFGGAFESVANILQDPDVDYNFEIPNHSDDNIIVTGSGEPVVVAARLLNEGETINYTFNIPKRESDIKIENLPDTDAIVGDAIAAANYSGSNDSSVPSTSQAEVRLQIPRIGVDSPVWKGINAEELLQQGFWVHPSSSNFGEGEVAMLCHRRYFGTEDPRTCWFLDQVQNGDKMYLSFGDADLTYEYEIVGTNIFDANSETIYTLSGSDDTIRLVTCTPLYSNTHRLVVLAKRVK